MRTTRPQTQYNARRPERTVRAIRKKKNLCFFFTWSLLTFFCSERITFEGLATVQCSDRQDLATLDLHLKGDVVDSLRQGLKTPRAVANRRDQVLGLCKQIKSAPGAVTPAIVPQFECAILKNDVSALGQIIKDFSTAISPILDTMVSTTLSEWN